MRYTLKPRDEALGALLLNAALVLLIAVGESGCLFVALPRLVLGLVAVIFLPGYMLHLIFFPRRDDLNGIERVALSFALSIAIIPPLALFLDAAPGLSLALWPIVLAEALVIVAVSGGAWLRRRYIADAECFQVVITWMPGSAWRSLRRVEKVLYGLLALTILAALFASAGILLAPRPSQHYTEFYLLSSDGLAQDFPRRAVAGENIEVIVGISNQERRTLTYQLEVTSESPELQRLMPVETFQLRPQESVERPLRFTLDSPGENIAVMFRLYVGQSPNPYRELRLFFNVVGGD